MITKNEKNISDEIAKEIVEALVSERIADIINVIKKSPKEAVEFVAMLLSSSSTPSKLRNTISWALGHAASANIDISPAISALGNAIRDDEIRMGAIDALESAVANNVQISPAIPNIEKYFYSLPNYAAYRFQFGKIILLHYLREKDWKKIEQLLKGTEGRVAKEGYAEALFKSAEKNVDLSHIARPLEKFILDKKTAGDAREMATAALVLNAINKNGTFGECAKFLSNADKKIIEGAAHALAISVEKGFDISLVIPKLEGIVSKLPVPRSAQAQFSDSNANLKAYIAKILTYLYMQKADSSEDKAAWWGKVNKMLRCRDYYVTSGTCDALELMESKGHEQAKQLLEKWRKFG